MDYNAIHKALKAESLTWKTAAAAIGCSPTNLMLIAARKSKSRPVAMRLAILIRKNIAEVFPDIESYALDPEGERNASLEAARSRLASAGMEPLTTKTG